MAQLSSHRQLTHNKPIDEESMENQHSLDHPIVKIIKIDSTVKQEEKNEGEDQEEEEEKPLIKRSLSKT